MFEYIQEQLTYLSKIVPIEVFTFVGSFLEDIIAPIPSPLVTTTTGTLAFSQGYGYPALIWFMIIAALGKTIACIILYIISDKAEDFILVRIGPKLGINHAQVEKLGTYFTGSPKDYIILTIIRALPIIPSLPVSVASGIIKIPMRLYIIATFIGTCIRSALFIILGYIGLSAYEGIINGIDSIESIAQIVIVVVLGSVVAWFYYKRSKLSFKN
jgi:membrane protein DedA with SNARE-associated domain